MTQQNNCNEICRFTLADKIVGQLALNAGVVVGAYAMYLSSPWLALAYLVYVYGGLVLVTRYTVCPRCPHLLEADDCLFMPVGFVRKVMSDFRSGPLRFGEKLILYAVFGGMALIPVYWLFSHLWLLALYVVAKVAVILVFGRYLCRKCQNEICPLNKPGNAA